MRLDVLSATFVGALRTVTRQSAYTPFCAVTRMVAVPAFTPRMLPLPSTVAIFLLLEAKVSVAMQSALP